MKTNQLLTLKMLRQIVNPACVILPLLLIFAGCHRDILLKPAWPSHVRESKPWTRWWWQGNALTKEGITAELEAYQEAGIGGVEITPIYGVYGYEDKFVDYLSPQFMALLIHTLKEAERLNMGVDMATGTGWPFGGPWVGDADACKNIEYKIYTLTGGETLKEKIEFIQAPYLRAVGNPIFIDSGGSPKTSMLLDPKTIAIKHLSQPVSVNKNLQSLALEQVKFERPLKLQALMAYNDSDKPLNLLDQLDDAGMLRWTAPAGHWRIYALFEGWHGKMVERAGPGGEGNVIDHFSATALQHYLSRFDSAFRGYDIKSLRAFFNDSYEVDDARGTADWTPALFDEFKQRRHYDLRDHLPALLGKDTKEMNERVRCDYRETIAELVLTNFTMSWKAWAKGKQKIIRNQAHGSPANILDLYAVVDIPEIEGIESLRIKMASSAGNVTGKKLVSAESATWLNEHFESNLGDVKGAVDRFLLNGVNHIFYHGTCYSPPEAPWPGWLFYAAVHLNPRNPLWNDFDALNEYVARAQSLLQRSHADNDVLLYFPIYDRYSTPGQEMVEHFDGVGKTFDSTALKHAAEQMLANGYAFDFISDRQIGQIEMNGNRLKTEGGAFYKTLVVPHCRYIPVTTLKKLLSLVQHGATLLFYEGFPTSFSGYAPTQGNEFEALIRKLTSLEKTPDEGKIITGEDLDRLLNNAGVARESIIDAGLQSLRKITPEGQVEYFIVNGNETTYQGWVPLQTHGAAVVLFDAMSGKVGKGKIRQGENGKSEVFINLPEKSSMFLRLYEDDVEVDAFQFAIPTGNAIALTGPWTITFTQGGPELPAPVKTDSLISWTSFAGAGYTSFSGTATYTLAFDKPAVEAAAWLLNLGRVKESAEVFLNGKLLATSIGPSYQVTLDVTSLRAHNILQVKVSNLMANRIADMDHRNVFWKKFYNVNFPARKAVNRSDGLFSAAAWAPHPSGLLGPVTLTAARLE